eukprot:3941931-Rhodomonas_salina.2
MSAASTSGLCQYRASHITSIGPYRPLDVSTSHRIPRSWTETTTQYATHHMKQASADICFFFFSFSLFFSPFFCYLRRMVPLHGSRRAALPEALHHLPQPLTVSTDYSISSH